MYGLKIVFLKSMKCPKLKCQLKLYEIQNKKIHVKWQLKRIWEDNDHKRAEVDTTKIKESVK